MSKTNFDAKYQLVYEPGSRIVNLTIAFVFYGFIGWLAWLSRDSVWWTFFFGTLALILVVGRVQVLLDRQWHAFHRKADLEAFVSKIPDDM